MTGYTAGRRLKIQERSDIIKEKYLYAGGNGYGSVQGNKHKSRRAA